MHISKLLKRFPVGWTLSAVLLLLVGLAVVDVMLDGMVGAASVAELVADLSFFLGSALTAAFILLLAWHFVVSIKKRTYRRLLLHIVTIPLCILAANFISFIYMFRLYS